MESNKDKQDNIETLIQEQEEIENKTFIFNWLDFPILTVFWTLLVIVALQFISRYIFNSSIPWTEEVARYLLVIVGFVGGITCVRNGKHIFLEFFYRYLPVTSIKPIAIIVEIIVATFFAYSGYLCIQLANKSKQIMINIPLPKDVLYYTVSLACFIMALFALINIYKYIKASKDEVYHEKLGAKI